jgi:hypothetical protein
MFVSAVTVKGWADTQEEFEGVAEIVFDCSRMAVVVPSRRDGIDEGHNQAHELSGSKEIVRVVISG